MAWNAPGSKFALTMRTGCDIAFSSVILPIDGQAPAPHEAQSSSGKALVCTHHSARAEDPEQLHTEHMTGLHGSDDTADGSLRSQWMLRTRD